ncbi:hypothetical protein BJ878DRAFT_137941 [Calycina marina]|uniref:Uncharacterized protein n=1 Tax=Calycina marina TaxID=1763456 RepID=A0A9P7YZV3_9HELO|nr:hypothetical protein BJ878DRAFT_137941 [Calycina marina]
MKEQWGRGLATVSDGKGMKWRELYPPRRGCVSVSGYNRWKIGAEEMKGMKLPRFFLRKPKDDDADNKEQTDYERKSEFIPTPHAITPPPDDFDPATSPTNLSASTTSMAKTTSSSNEDDQPIDIPIHAACWERFEQVSELLLGELDLQGFKPAVAAASNP